MSLAGTPKVRHALFAGTLGMDGRISRPALARNKAVWWTFSGMFGLISLLVLGVALLFPSMNEARLLPFAALLFAVSAISHKLGPPAIGTVGNHIAIACVYVCVSIGLVAFAPSASLIPLGPLMFAGALTVVRLQSRVQIAGHIVAAAVITGGTAALAVHDRSVQFAVASMIPAVAFLASMIVLVLETAERQGDELEGLVRRDPLTGVGNRRMLNETLEEELQRHTLSGAEFSLITLDLNGFKALNDELGHDAGDALLRAVAEGLQTISRDQDVVVRQGGDEFCVVCPDTSEREAKWVEKAIATALAGVIAGEIPITTGIGTATFPLDGLTADELLRVADRRLGHDKERVGRARAEETAAEVTGPRTAVISPAAIAAAAARAASALMVRVSRREFAKSRYIWFGVGAQFAVFGAVACACTVLLDGNAEWASALCVVWVATAIWVFATPAPGIGSIRNHVVLALDYVTAAAFMAAFPSVAGAAFGVVVFIGPLIAVRLIDRGQIAAHFAAASAVFISVVMLGLVSQTVGLSMLNMLLSFLGLGFTCIVVLEAAEEQGEELEELVRRDPLTGLGNRRLLQEQLDLELVRHTALRRPFSVLALDLNGFKALNDHVGHAAGDELLQTVAAILQKVCRPEDTAVRQGGDEFCMILPQTTDSEAKHAATAIRDRLAEIETHGLHISTGIGIATYPFDAITQEALLRIADDQLRADKEAAPKRGDLTFTVVPRTVPRVA